MASGQILEDLTEFITCTICYNSFKGRDPRILSCHHAFCFQCLLDIYSSTKYQSIRDEIQCPTCQTSTMIKDKSLESLPPYFQAHQIMDILKKAEVTPEYMTCMVCKRMDANGCCFTCARTLCGSCKPKHDKTKHYDSHVSISCTKDQLHNCECSSHHELVETFCTQCYMAICKKCLLLNHEGHKYTDFCKGSKDLSGFEKHIFSKMENAKGNIDSIDGVKNDIEENIQVIESDIYKQQAECHRQIDERVKTLKSKLDDLKLSAHIQLEYIRNLNSNIVDSLEIVQPKFLKLKEPISLRGDISLQHIDTLIDELSSQVTCLNPFALEIGNIYFTPDVKEIPVGGFGGTFLHANDANSYQAFSTNLTGIHQPQLNKFHHLWSAKVNGGVRNVSMLPSGDVISISGFQSPRLLIHNATGNEMPLPAALKDLKDPLRVAVNMFNKITAILENTNQTCTLLKMDDDVHVVSEFCINMRPMHVTVLACGDIIVTGGQSSNTVCRYNISGQKVMEKTLPHKCLSPCVDSTGRLILSVDNHLKIYNEQFQLIATYGTGDSSDLENPSGVCFDKEDNIVVADSGRKQIILLNSAGKFIKELVPLRDNEVYVHIALHEDMFLIVGSVMNEDIQLYQININS